MAITLASFLIILSFADGYSDPYYLKVSSPRKANLMLGTSKCAQGLQPHSMQNILNKSFYNYAFSIFVSPYGSTYLNSIKNKLDTTITDNISILAVDPWSLCSMTDDPDDSSGFRENRSFLNYLINVNQSPNYKYLVRYFEGCYYRILLKNSPALLKNDGWLDVTLNDDSMSIRQRTQFTIKTYEEKLKQYRFSDLRYTYLLKTINYLQTFGKVYLVQLPVHPNLSNIEHQLMPDFNTILQSVIEKSDGYLDLTIDNSKYTYTDGVHLDKKSGREVSEQIANWIKERY
jgi:hypothetical protein